MPVISTFYGLIIRMFFFDTDRHTLPHIHVEFGEFRVVLSIQSAEVLAGSLPLNKLKLARAWIEMHREELFADWELAVRGEAVFKIEPLR